MDRTIDNYKIETYDNIGHKQRDMDSSIAWAVQQEP